MYSRVSRKASSQYGTDRLGKLKQEVEYEVITDKIRCVKGAVGIAAPCLFSIRICL